MDTYESEDPMDIERDELEEMKEERQSLYEMVIRQKQGIKLMKEERDEKNEEIDHFIYSRRDVQREKINKKKHWQKRRDEWERLRNEIIKM